MEIRPCDCAVVFRSSYGHDVRRLGKFCSVSHDSGVGFQEQG